jgi:hypothetical protein
MKMSVQRGRVLDMPLYPGDPLAWGGRKGIQAAPPLRGSDNHQIRTPHFLR